MTIQNDMQKVKAALADAISVHVAKAVAVGKDESVIEAEVIAIVGKQLKAGMTAGQLVDLARALGLTGKEPRTDSLYERGPLADAIKRAFDHPASASHTASAVVKDKESGGRAPRGGAGTWTPDFTDMAKTAMEKPHNQDRFQTKKASIDGLARRAAGVHDSIYNKVG